LHGVSVKQELLSIQPNVVELSVELVGRDELPALGIRISIICCSPE
jgi:hypothetical protein